MIICNVFAFIAMWLHTLFQVSQNYLNVSLTFNIIISIFVYRNFSETWGHEKQNYFQGRVLLSNLVLVLGLQAYDIGVNWLGEHYITITILSLSIIVATLFTIKMQQDVHYLTSETSGKQNKKSE